MIENEKRGGERGREGGGGVEVGLFSRRRGGRGVGGTHGPYIYNILFM